MSDGNVFIFSFSSEGFEAIVNLTAIYDEERDAALMAVLNDEDVPETSVNGIINMMKLRAQANQQRKMEVWMVKLDESFNEEDLNEWADTDPQAVANLARMGEAVFKGFASSSKQVIL